MIDSIDNLAHQLSKLPSIGSKTAQRLAYAILEWPASEVTALANALTEAKERVRFCEICGHYTENQICTICANEKRKNGVICVVKDPRDVIAMEKTHEYDGRYHVLHGIISPMNGVGPSDIRIPELLKRLEAENIQEVILATNSDVEGEATASYIAQILKDKNISVTRIAHGIPIGSNLEYIDELTLGRALSQRREM